MLWEYWKNTQSFKFKITWRLSCRLTNFKMLHTFLCMNSLIKSLTNLRLNGPGAWKERNQVKRNALKVWVFWIIWIKQKKSQHVRWNNWRPLGELVNVWHTHKHTSHTNCLSCIPWVVYSVLPVRLYGRAGVRRRLKNRFQISIAIEASLATVYLNCHYFFWLYPCGGMESLVRRSQNTTVHC